MFTDAQRTELAKPLNPANVKPPAPGKYGEYIEGWRVIDEANRIFGFDGWSRETVEMSELCRAERDGKWYVSFVAKARITAGGITREGTGCGSGDGMKSLGDAIESAIKEAETDAMKRALMTFGNPFGLALYDKTKANVQAPPPEMVSDEIRDELALTAEGAGVTLQAICKRYNIASLKELPADKAEEVRAGLQATIAQRAQKQAA
jgi:DNA repair and recombination protein RAD52